MKKHLIWVVLCLTCLLLSACAHAAGGSPSDTIKDQPSNLSPSDYRPMLGDWPAYTSSDQLVNAAEAVFLGKITDISFLVLDGRSGKPADDSTDAEHRELNTVYKVDVLTVYKGEVPEVAQCKAPGGLRGYREDSQLALLRSNGLLDQDEKIPIAMDADGRGIDARIGQTYLFAMRSSSNPSFLNVLNLNQSVFPLDEPTQASANTGDLSPQDVIKEFGNEKWEEFYQHWSSHDDT